MESIQKRPEALELAQRCKMGDTAAMEAMALHYRTLCGPVLQALLDAYEIRPGEENRRALHLCLEENREARLPAEAYMMWLLRAARFGSRAAAERVRQLPYFMDYGARDHLEVYQAFPWERLIDLQVVSGAVVHEIGQLPDPLRGGSASKPRSPEQPHHVRFRGKPRLPVFLQAEVEGPPVLLSRPDLVGIQQRLEHRSAQRPIMQSHRFHGGRIPHFAALGQLQRLRAFLNRLHFVQPSFVWKRIRFCN